MLNVLQHYIRNSWKTAPRVGNTASLSQLKLGAKKRKRSQASRPIMLLTKIQREKVHE